MGWFKIVEAPQHGSIFDANATFTGKLTDSGSLYINCRFDGDISAEGELTVGPKARLTSTVNAGTAVVGGTITGNLSAAKRIEILSTATVTGDITAPAVTIHAGASIQGRLTIGPKAGAQVVRNISDRLSA